MKKYLIVRLNNSNSNVSGFIFDGLQTTLNPNLTPNFTYNEAVKLKDNLNSFDKDFKYVVWETEAIV